MIAFIGTAAADTVLAGAGSVRYTIARGHYGPGVPRPIYGQLAVVERAERLTPPALRQALEKAHRTVVLVPWDYAVDCQRVPWNRSARWVQPGTRGMFIARLRDPAHWVGERPTFDVTPDVAIYPPIVLPHRFRRGGPLLTAEEFFALYEVVPDDDSLRTAPDDALAPVLRWAETHPDLAGRPPARDLIWQIRRRADEARYRGKPSPIAGTWRVVYQAASGDSVAFYARSELHPTVTLRPRVLTPEDAGPPPLQPAIGHSLLVQAAPTQESLPSRPAMSEREFAMQGYFGMLDAPIAATPDSMVLAGSIDLEDEAARLAPDSVTRRALQEAARQKRELHRDAYRRNEHWMPGRFVLTPDGRGRFATVIERDGARLLTVRAERVSTAHLRREPTVRRP